MRHAPRGLSEEEAAAWAALAASVKPLHAGPAPAAKLPKRAPAPASPRPRTTASPPLKESTGIGAPSVQRAPTTPTRPPPRGGGGLDSHWDRRLKAGEIAPDVSFDLHGHGLERAYDRLMDGMAQARSMDARTVLVVTGKPRGGDAADRGERRGAIRAKILDWLAASEHGGAIAAVRTAHRRHGGEGALYVVLRRGR